MKTNPYVAIHCWKALSLSIVRCPLKTIFIKGPVSKLYIKISAITAHLSSKVQDFSKVDIGFSMQRSLKDAGLHLKLPIKACINFVCIVFSKQNVNKLVPGRIWLCAPYFERVLHGEIHAKFRCEHCTVISKCWFFGVVPFKRT